MVSVDFPPHRGRPHNRKQSTCWWWCFRMRFPFLTLPLKVQKLRLLNTFVFSLYWMMLRTTPRCNGNKKSMWWWWKQSLTDIPDLHSRRLVTEIKVFWEATPQPRPLWWKIMAGPCLEKYKFWEFSVAKSLTKKCAKYWKLLIFHCLAHNVHYASSSQQIKKASP